MTEPEVPEVELCAGAQLDLLGGSVNVEYSFLSGCCGASVGCRITPAHPKSGKPRSTQSELETFYCLFANFIGHHLMAYIIVKLA